jgi:hypothetical protein
MAGTAQSGNFDREKPGNRIYFTDYGLTGQSTYLLQCWSQRPMPKFFTVCTLTDKLNVFPLPDRKPTTDLEGGWRVGLSANLVVLQFVFISPITLLLGRSCDCGQHARALSDAARSPNLFHRLHFDWRP